MATEVRSFQVTIPAATAIASPVTVNTSFPSMTVDVVHIRVPSGPSGLMGFRLTMGNSQVIPINLGAWLIMDDDKVEWPLTNLPNSGQWAVTGYNTDIYDHQIYIDFLLSPLGSASQAAQQQAQQQAQAVNDVLAMSGGGTG
jgi:hypothetical protein